MRIERLGELGSAPTVLATVGGAGSSAGLPPPAALIGDWFGSQAVIAPTVTAAPVPAGAVFDVPHEQAPDDDEANGPVGGGWFGYLSYPDAGADGSSPRIPEAAGGWSDCVLRQAADGCWWFESLSGATVPEWLTPALSSPHRPSQSPSRITWGEADRAAHQRGVTQCLSAIAAGEVYQACVCTQFAGRLDGAPLDFFVDVVARTSPARAAFVAGPWGAVASLSPELFLHRRGRAVTSSPIKGTLPRDADPAELRASVKDVAENIMIVDLVRNDLSRIAATGTVTVPELLVVRAAPGVWHLVSTVAAEVAPDVPMSAVLEAMFPPASVTGTPKLRARQLLRSWEPLRRGVYCGTVGLASPVAGCELNVAIRTVEFDAGGAAVLGVGGGITADSDPGLEWDECLHKAAPIIGATRTAGTVRRESRPGASAR